MSLVRRLEKGKDLDAAGEGLPQETLEAMPRRANGGRNATSAGTLVS